MTTPTPSSHPSRVVVDVTIAAPIERVWEALRNPALLAQWFGWDYDKLAEEIDAYFVAGGVEAEAGRRLDLGGDVFELEVAGSGTRVRLVRAEPPASDTWDGVYDDVDEGWRTFLAQLAFWLEAQHGVNRDVRPRRTVYLAGHREQADAGAAPLPPQRPPPAGLSAPRPSPGRPAPDAPASGRRARRQSPGSASRRSPGRPPASGLPSGPAPLRAACAVA